ncbi:MAG: DUF6170 family protein [Gammaproteobacteria bacterium]|nr:DUF6170 family protein [Gammaproteobacteria bacterium]
MIYFSPRKIKALEGFTALERAQIVAMAARDMPFERKALANTLKVILLVAMFWILLDVPGIALKITALIAVGLLYPLVLQPITLTLAIPYIPKAAERFNRSKSFAQDAPDGDGEDGGAN